MADSLPPVCASSRAVFGVSRTFSPEILTRKAQQFQWLTGQGEQVRMVSDHLSYQEKEDIEKGWMQRSLPHRRT
jgi:hypothetical protein